MMMKKIRYIINRGVLLFFIIIILPISFNIWQSFLFETLELPSPFPLILILGLITFAAFIIFGLYFKSVELLFALTYWFMMAGLGVSFLYAGWEEMQRQNEFIDLSVAAEAVVINSERINKEKCLVNYTYTVDKTTYTKIEETTSCRIYPPQKRIAIRYIPPSPSQAMILRNGRGRRERFDGCLALIIPPFIFFGVLTKIMSPSKND